MAISTAVSLDRLSRVVGYKIAGIDLRETTPNLPIRIGVIGEGNFANQGTMDMNPLEISTVKEAGDMYGYGSPVYHIMRILKPLQGGSLGGVPIVVYPIPGTAGVQAVRTLTITGTPTTNGTHAVVINGRMALDGQTYTYVVTTTDTPTTIAQKIADAVNSVSGSPVIATNSAGVVTLTAKWKGITSNELDVSTNTFGFSLGLTYVVASPTAGSGNPDITSVLNNFGNAWTTFLINPFGSLVFTDLETLNGTPHLTNPTGRWASIVFKPFISFFGSKLSVKASLAAITGDNARKTQATNQIALAPNSKGFNFEAAANKCYDWAVIAKNTPHLDVSNVSYPDMPVPTDLKIGDLSVYDNRDYLVKNGCSTVDIVNGTYTIQDSVTTYRPDGDTAPQWQYTRALIQDWNIRFGMIMLEDTYVRDHMIAGDSDIVNVEKVIKPKQYISILRTYADDLERRGLITDSEFTKGSIQVGISTVNPNRLDVTFAYKRSGYVRVISTTVQAGFNYGKV